MSDTLRDSPDQSLIDTIVSLRSRIGPDGLSIATLVDSLDERAFGLLILLFALPCLVPGLPGAQVIAIPILLLSLQMALGRREPWLPRWVLNLTVRADWAEATIAFADTRLRWTERLSRPRLAALSAGVAERVIALAMALAALTIIIPITNTVPSLAITLASVGLLQRDGLFTTGGVLLALGWICGLVLGVVAVLSGAEVAVRLLAEHAPWLLQLIRPRG